MRKLNIFRLNSHNSLPVQYMKSYPFFRWAACAAGAVAGWAVVADAQISAGAAGVAVAGNPAVRQRGHHVNIVHVYQWIYND